MSQSQPSRPTRFRSGGLSQRKPTRFFWTPDAETRRALADELGLLALYRLEFTGEIAPVGRFEFRLQGQLKAAVDQACIVTLAPVPASIDDTVLRRYVTDLPAPLGEETEVPEDDSPEPLPETLDLIEIATEALMLALPLYPRAAGAEFTPASPPDTGEGPDGDTPQKPFAGLAALADRLKSGPKTPGKDGE